MIDEEEMDDNELLEFLIDHLDELTEEIEDYGNVCIETYNRKLLEEIKNTMCEITYQHVEGPNYRYQDFERFLDLLDWLKRHVATLVQIGRTPYKEHKNEQ